MYPRMLLPLFTVLLAACPSPTGQKQKPKTSAPDPVARVNAAVRAATSYRAVLETTVNPAALMPAARKMKADPDELKMTVHTELAAKLPDRMRQTFRMTNADTEMRTTLVYAGDWVWVSTAMQLPSGKGAVPGKPHVQTLKQQQRGLAPPDRPFDTGYAMRGHGLEEGLDLVGTLQAYLKRYRFHRKPTEEAVGSEPCLLLVGRHDPRAFMDEMLARPSVLGPMILARESEAKAGIDPRPDLGLPAMAAQVIKMTAVWKVWVSSRDYLPRRWSLGDGDTEMMRVEVKAIDPAVKHPAGTFDPEPAWKESASDITEQTRQARKRIAVAAADKRAAAAIRAQIVKLLK